MGNEDSKLTQGFESKVDKNAVGGKVVESFPEELVVYTIEFMDFQNFLKCHCLNRRIYYNLSQTFNCYRIWFNYFRSMIPNYTPEMDKPLHELYKKYDHDFSYWKRKVQEKSMVDNVETVDVFSKHGNEFWFTTFSPDGKKIFGCGENGWTIFEKKDERFPAIVVEGEELQKYNEFCPTFASSGKNTIYGNFSPNSEKYFAVTENGTGFVYDLTLRGTKKAPYLDSLKIKERRDFEEVKGFLESMLYLNGENGLYVLGDPSIVIRDGEEEEDGEEESFRNHEGLCHYFSVEGFSKKPCFFNDDYLVYIPDPRIFENIISSTSPSRSKGYEIMKIRVEKLKKVYNSTSSSQSNLFYNEMRVHLDLKNFQRRIEVDLGRKRSDDDGRQHEFIRRIDINLFNLEKKEKKKCVFGFESGFCEDSDTCDSVFFVTLPHSFFDFIININLKIKDKEEQEDEEGYDILLSKLEYIYLDGPISQLEYVGNELFVLHRPCTRDEESPQNGKINLYYQLLIYDTTTLKKKVNLTPTIPNVIDTDTYFIFIDITEDYITIGSEASLIVVWDRTTWQHLTTVKNKYSLPVSAVSFSPMDNTLFSAASDDGTIRVMRFRGNSKKLESDVVLDNHLKEMEKYRLEQEENIRLMGNDLLLEEGEELESLERVGDDGEEENGGMTNMDEDILYYLNNMLESEEERVLLEQQRQDEEEEGEEEVRQIFDGEKEHKDEEGRT